MNNTQKNILDNQLTEEDYERYNRQIILKEIGISGQKKLYNSKILIVGTGGLGSPSSMYLAGSGIGTIGLADFDEVSLSNLGRQIIHTTGNIGKSKVDSAYEYIKNLNPNINVVKHNVKVDIESAYDIVNGYDFVIDASDNFETKFLLNDICIDCNIPFSHAGVIRFEGQILTVIPKKTACYRCVFNDIPKIGTVPVCSTSGILGPVAGVLGSFQAVECIKYLCNIGELLTDNFLVIDALTMKIRKVKVKRRINCNACGK